MRADIILIRAVFTLILVIAGYWIHPISDWVVMGRTIPSRLLSALAALIIASGIIFFELRIRKASLKTLIGAAIGSTLGIIASTLVGFLISVQH